MRKAWYKLPFILLLVMLLCSCTEDSETGYEPLPNTEAYRINEEIPCEQYDYFFEDNNGANLTLTAEPTSDTDSIYHGQCIITDYDSYKAILDVALAREPDKLQKTQSAFSPDGLTEEDFEQYDFLMVDAYFGRTERLYPRLDDLEVDDHTVFVELQYDSWGRVCGNEYGCGVLYFIPIPKGCTEAEVVTIPTSFED